MSNTSDSTDSASARATRSWRAAEAAGGRPDVPPRKPGEATDAQFISAVRATIALLLASRRLLRALGKLAAAEWQILRFGIPLLVVAVAALAMFGMALWFCLMALVGWVLLVATGSLELALGLLVVIQFCLIGCAGLVIMLLIRQLTMPRARRELKVLRHTLMRDVKRAAGITPSRRSAQAGTSQRAPDQ